MLGHVEFYRKMGQRPLMNPIIFFDYATNTSWNARKLGHTPLICEDDLLKYNLVNVPKPRKKAKKGEKST